MKRMLTMLLTALLLFSLGSCTDKDTYRDDLDTDVISDRMLASLSDGVTYLRADSGYLNDYFTTPDYVSDLTVRFASDGNNLNEMGVFHTEEGKADEMAAVLRSYLADSLTRNETWYRSYIPEEVPKLRDAELRVCGNYVAYAIFDAAERKNVLQAMDDALKTDGNS